MCLLPLFLIVSCFLVLAFQLFRVSIDHLGEVLGFVGAFLRGSFWACVIGSRIDGHIISRQFKRGNMRNVGKAKVF